jgi:hypothetical protein
MLHSREKRAPAPTNDASQPDSDPLRSDKPRVDHEGELVVASTERWEGRFLDTTRGHAYGLHTYSDDEAG